MELRAVTLQSPDPAASAGFYADRLGLETLVAREADGVRTRHGVVLGRSVLWFTPGDAGPAHHVAMNVAEHRFDDVLGWMRERVTVLADDRDPPYLFASWNAHSAYFLDHDGNVIEFIARHALPSTYAGPPGPAIVESISEVGLPVSDVGPAIAWLSARLDLPHFDVTGNRFGAIGDHHGLLIVVPTDRSWYPTTIPSRIRPITIETPGLEDDLVALADHPYEIRVSASPSGRGRGGSS